MVYDHSSFQVFMKDFYLPAHILYFTVWMLDRFGLCDLNA